MKRALDMESKFQVLDLRSQPVLHHDQKRRVHEAVHGLNSTKQGGRSRCESFPVVLTSSQYQSAFDRYGHASRRYRNTVSEEQQQEGNAAPSGLFVCGAQLLPARLHQRQRRSSLDSGVPLKDVSYSEYEHGAYWKSMARLKQLSRQPVLQSKSSARVSHIGKCLRGPEFSDSLHVVDKQCSKSSANHSLPLPAADAKQERGCKRLEKSAQPQGIGPTAQLHYPKSQISSSMKLPAVALTNDSCTEGNVKLLARLSQEERAEKGNSTIQTRHGHEKATLVLADQQGKCHSNQEAHKLPDLKAATYNRRDSPSLDDLDREVSECDIPGPPEEPLVTAANNESDHRFSQQLKKYSRGKFPRERPLQTSQKKGVQKKSQDVRAKAVERHEKQKNQDAEKEKSLRAQQRREIYAINSIMENDDSQHFLGILQSRM